MEQPPTDQPTEPKFEPYKPAGGKIRKPGTGCVTMINDHLYEGRFSPRASGKRISKNIYATTHEEYEEKLKLLIAEMKSEIAEIGAVYDECGVIKKASAVRFPAEAEFNYSLVST